MKGKNKEMRCLVLVRKRNHIKESSKERKQKREGGGGDKACD